MTAFYISFYIRLNSNVRKLDITLLKFMSKLFNILSKKEHIKRKKYTVVLNGHHVAVDASTKCVAENKLAKSYK